MEGKKTKEKLNCYHCGDPCNASVIHFNKKDFCCRGCKTVYEILSDNELVEYYELENKPGIKKEEVVFTDFSYLDIQKIKEALLSFSSERTERVTFNVPAIHCSSCIWLLENLDQIRPEITRSEVNFLKKEVNLQYDPSRISLRQVAELMDSIGYKPLVYLDEKDRNTANKRKDLSYIYKLGISGFAFGNIMLLSFPEYFSEGMYDDEDFGRFFGMVNLVLALPVFFYCSNSYFISAWKGLKNKFLNIDVPISLGIIVLFLRSNYEIFTGTGAGYFDSMTGLVFFLLVGRWFQNRTYQSLSFERDYKNYFPLGVSRIKEGKTETTLLKDVQVGDELVIHHGEIIPADAVLLSESAEIDYSFVTGESEAIQVSKGNKLFAGGRQMGGQILLKVEKAFSQSYLMQLWKQEDKIGKKDEELSGLIDKVSQYFTVIIMAVAIVSSVYWWFNDPSLTFHAFSSVLIIACPCALALTIPFTFGNGIRLLEKSGIYLRDARFIEVLSKITCIVFDKTGTITSQKNKSVQYEGTELDKNDVECIVALSANSTHPLSRMIYNHLGSKTSLLAKDYSEVPGKGINAIVNSKKIFMGSSEYVGSRDSRTGTSVYVKIGNEIKGRFIIGNEYRKGLSQLIHKIEKNYEVHLVTGDGEGELENLKKFFGNADNLSFNMDPFAKRDYIERLQKEGKKVLMIGDGLNDAGAIRSSNVGVSISDDIFGFLPSCDVILEAEEFEKIPNLLSYAKSMKKLVIVGFIISFLYNIVGLTFAVQGILSPVVAAILMPLSSISVVAFAIFSTNVLARRCIIL